MSEEHGSKYNLEERTAVFGEEVIVFLKTIPDTALTIPVKSQLVRSATSVGANYCEADDAESKKDFRHKIGICKKEARESGHWLRMLTTLVPKEREKIEKLRKEAKELNLIFNTIFHKTK